MNITKKARLRFWRKVNISGPDDCWLWLAYKHPTGYGRISINGEPQYAHRVSYILKHGHIPDGLHILHHCDNPGCVNPKHLYAGTQQDNVNDRHIRGRTNTVYGEDASNTKLTEEDVKGIRRLYSTGKYTHKELATMYDVSRSAIMFIVHRKTWTHI